MRTFKTIAVIGLLLKAVVVGVLCTDRVARASAEPAGKAKGESARSASAAVPADVLARSRGFREMLDAVERRSGVLDQREQAVATREASLKALEKTLADEIARLDAQGGRAAAKAAPGAAATAGAAPAPTTGGAAVTKIYESMKPEEAAPILDKLDDATVKAIFGHMKEKQIGALLAVMNRERAVALTKALAADH